MKAHWIRKCGLLCLLFLFSLTSGGWLSCEKENPEEKQRKLMIKKAREKEDQERAARAQAIERVKTTRTKHGFDVLSFFEMVKRESNKKISDPKKHVLFKSWFAACAAEICTVTLNFKSNGNDLKAIWAVGEEVTPKNDNAKGFMQRNKPIPQVVKVIPIKRTVSKPLVRRKVRKRRRRRRRRRRRGRK